MDEKLLKGIYLESLEDGRHICLTVQGSSMYPFMKNNDVLTIENPQDGFKIGDIAIIDYFPEDKFKFIGHRIVKIKNDNGKATYFVKGDNFLKGVEGPITGEKIKGRVRAIKRQDLYIDFNNPFMKRLNIVIAFLSLKTPRLLIVLGKIIDLTIEWPWILEKIKIHFKKGNDPFLYNAEKLLLILARSNLDAKLRNETVVLIEEGLYWTHFCKSVLRCGVTLLVYNALKMLAPCVRIPQFVLDKLQSGFISIVSKTTSQHQELLGIIGLFNKEGIPVLPLKGTFLAKQLYADISLRGISLDFDFLIKEKDRDKVKKILETAGYQSTRTDEVKEWQWQCVFMKPKTTSIDLHWDITMMGRSKGRIEGLWRGTRLVNEDSISYYEFKEEELLLYLSAHLVNSGCCTQLKYICDINELLREYKHLLDWERIIEKAKEWRLSNSLYTALRLSKSLFDSRLPPGVLPKLKPNFLKLILIKVFVNKKVILRSGLRRHFIDSFLSYIFFELIEAQTAKEYLSVFKRVFFPPKEAIGNRNYIIRIFKGLLKLVSFRYNPCPQGI